MPLNMSLYISLSGICGPEHILPFLDLLISIMDYSVDNPEWDLTDGEQHCVDAATKLWFQYAPFDVLAPHLKLLMSVAEGEIWEDEEVSHHEL